MYVFPAEIIDWEEKVEQKLLHHFINLKVFVSTYVWGAKGYWEY